MPRNCKKKLCSSVTPLSLYQSRGQTNLKLHYNQAGLIQPHNIDMNIIRDHTGLKHVGAFPQDTSEITPVSVDDTLAVAFLILWRLSGAKHDVLIAEDGMIRWTLWDHDVILGLVHQRTATSRDHAWLSEATATIWWHATINLTWRAPHPMITRLLAPCLIISETREPDKSWAWNMMWLYETITVRHCIYIYLRNA